MKVFCSTSSLDEAVLVIRLGADIVDVKNPVEGSLGAPPPWVVREIAEYARQNGIPVSVAIGDLPAKPGTAALAAYGAAHCDVQFIKAGLFGTRTIGQAVQLLSAVRQAVGMVSPTIQLVAGTYADHRAFGGIAPLDLARAANKCCDAILVDTYDKRAGHLLDFMTETELSELVEVAHDRELQVALAGSIDIQHIPALQRLKPDFVGVRGGLCASGDRTGRIDTDRARSFLEAARGRGGSAEALAHPR